MLMLTFNAVLRCVHVTGLVANTHAQDWVTISEPSAGDRAARDRTPILIEPDPEGRPIVGCPNINIGIWPCLQTLAVREGYSSFVRIGGQRVCLKSIVGRTNGSPGNHDYRVSNAGQNFVECGA